MTDLRVYIPVTPAQLAEFAETGELAPEPVTGFAVGAAIRAAYGDGDEELWEFGAQQEAAAAAASGGPVLVLAVEVAPTRVTTPDPESAEVLLSGPVPVSALRAVLVGDDLLTGATVVPGEEEIELSWYDPTELPVVLDLGH